MQVKFTPLSPLAKKPTKATSGAACFDVHAAINHTLELGVGQSLVISTGLAVEVPVGHVMLVFSRSGHGFNSDIRLANCVGVIDSDYRGPLMVKLTRDHKHEEKQPPLLIRPFDRIAQCMIIPVLDLEFVEVDELTETDRGAGGLGSTGA